MLAVWEPILPMDWGPPSGSTLARLPDRRVRQFWDPSHVIASALGNFANQRPEQPHPQCCLQKGFHWDEAILYAPHVHWKDAPAAVFWNGPVVRVLPGFEAALKEQLGAD